MLTASCIPPVVCCVASKSLATFGHDTTALANILVRIALQEDTATGMLLCSFEIHQSSDTSGQWAFYLGGVKTVLNASSIKTLRQLGPDVAVLLDWVHYHEVLARFSLLHWKREKAPELRSTPTELFCSEVNMRLKLYEFLKC